MKDVRARALLLAGIVAIGLGVVGEVWWAWPRLFPDPLAQAHRAYDRGDWRQALRRGRHALKERGGGPRAPRLLGPVGGPPRGGDLARSLSGPPAPAPVPGAARP